MTAEHQSWAQLALETGRRTPVELPAYAQLERLVADLDAADESGSQTRLTLDALLGLSRADCVALVPLGSAHAGGDRVQLAGRRLADDGQLRRLAEALADHGDGGDSQLAARLFGPAVLADCARGWPGGAPAHAAIVRLARGRPAWLLAISTAPERPPAPGTLGAMRLAVRLLRSRQRSARYSADLSEALMGVVQSFAAVIDAKDPYTYGHSERVARMAARIGRQMGLPAGTVNDLYLAGLLHDVGKVGVPEAVLAKPGRLTDAEFALVREHPATGDRVLAGIKQLAHVRPGVRGHHERIDGRGYPDGLAGDAIPLIARVLAVADTCDAMLSARPYRPALEPLAVETELLKGRGSQWDAAAVEGFLGCRHEIYAIRQTGLGQSVYQAVNQAVNRENASQADILLTSVGTDRAKPGRS